MLVRVERELPDRLESLPYALALPDGGAAEGGSQPGDAGTMGGPCSAAGTCGPGLTCVGPALVPGSAERYCAPSCASNADCQAFAQSSYELQVPDTFTPLGGSPQGTNWKTPADTGGLATLSRGVVCASSSGSASGPKVCQFGCPNFMGVRLDANGNENVCSCIPGYSFTADKLACQFGGHQCSIFSYGTDAQRAGLLSQFGIQTQNPKCDACNSNTQFTDALGCHSNQFFCNVDTTALNGECAETLSTAQFNQCVAAKTNFSCTCSGHVRFVLRQPADLPGLLHVHHVERAACRADLHRRRWRGGQRLWRQRGDGRCERRQRDEQRQRHVRGHHGRASGRPLDSHCESALRRRPVARSPTAPTG